MPKRPSNQFRPAVEALEQRRFMAADLTNGVLTIQATDFDDTVIVRNEQLVLQLRGGLKTHLSTVVVEENGVVTGRFNPWDITRIEGYMHQGNDYFRNDTAINSMVLGGQGNDTLIGGSGRDELYGRKDNDTLMGRGGEDFLFGEDGNDRLDGGADGIVDHLFGGIQADTFVADKYPTGPSIFQNGNRDVPIDFNAAEGDTIDWGYWYYLTMEQ
jgi:Ca2+-binding RTX toxin-like protein